MNSVSPVLISLCALFTVGEVLGGPKTSALELSATVPIVAAPDNAAANANLTGSWQVSWATAKGNQREVTMQIKQDRNKLSGSFQGARGSAPLKGSVKGNEVSFSVKVRRRQVSFSGTVDGNKMSGTTEQGASWTAIRQ